MEAFNRSLGINSRFETLIEVNGDCSSEQEGQANHFLGPKSCRQDTFLRRLLRHTSTEWIDAYIGIEALHHHVHHGVRKLGSDL